MSAPARTEIAVAVAAGPRPLRLRWLLNGLEGQDAAFEVVVARRPGSGGPAAWDHPLLAGDRGRVVDVPAGAGDAAALDAAWRAARAPLVAFVDEHVRVPEGWLGRAVALARAAALARERAGFAGEVRSMEEDRSPGESASAGVGGVAGVGGGGLVCEGGEAVVAGRLRPDPLERALLFAPFHRTREVRAGDPFAPATGTVWPRGALERLGGLDLGAPSADLAGADLLTRARREGIAVVPADDLVLFDAVLPGDARALAADAQLAWLVRRHPHLRDALALRAFRSRGHAALALALAGAVLARRRPAAAALALPWAATTAARVPPRAVPGRLARRAVRDGVEVTALAAGSLRHGALVL